MKIERCNPLDIDSEIKNLRGRIVDHEARSQRLRAELSILTKRGGLDVEIRNLRDWLSLIDHQKATVEGELREFETDLDI